MWFRSEACAALFKSFIAAMTLSGIFYSSAAYAFTTPPPDLQTMLINFANNIPSLFRLVTAFCYLVGMYFMIAAIMGMKHFGEMRTMASQEHSISGPVIEFLVGAAMIYLPTTIRASLSTFWIHTNPHAYLNATQDQFYVFNNAVFYLMELLGAIAFVRGLLILKAAGSGRAQQGSLGKALAHIVGGILLINMYNSIQIFAASIGWTN